MYFKNWCLCVLEGPGKVIYDIVLHGKEESIKKAKGCPQNIYYHIKHNSQEKLESYSMGGRVVCSQGTKEFIRHENLLLG